MKSRKGGHQQKKVRKGLKPSYQADFDRKDSASRPEILKRIVISIANSSVASSGNAVFSQANAGGVVNTAEFQSIAQNLIFRQFRVVAMRVRVVGTFAAPISPTFQGMGPLIGSIGTSTVPPNSVTGMLSSQGFRVSQHQLPYLELKVDSGINPNALLWSHIDGTGTATLQPENELSVAWRFCRAADPLYNGKTVTDEFYEYDVEFRTAG